MARLFVSIGLNCGFQGDQQSELRGYEVRVFGDSAKLELIGKARETR